MKLRGHALDRLTLADRSPEGVEQIRALIASLAADLERMREALAFYADSDTWTQPTSWGGRIHDDESAAIKDGGKTARAALAGGQET